MLLIFDEFGSDIDRHSNSKITAKYIIDKPEEWVKQDSQKLNLKSHLPHDSKYAVVIDSLSTALIKFDAQELYLQLVELIQHGNFSFSSYILLLINLNYRKRHTTCLPNAPRCG